MPNCPLWGALWRPAVVWAAAGQAPVALQPDGVLPPQGYWYSPGTLVRAVGTSLSHSFPKTWAFAHKRVVQEAVKPLRKLPHPTPLHGGAVGTAQPRRQTRVCGGAGREGPCGPPAHIGWATVIATLLVARGLLCQQPPSEGHQGHPMGLGGHAGGRGRGPPLPSPGLTACYHARAPQESVVLCTAPGIRDKPLHTPLGCLCGCGEENGEA